VSENLDLVRSIYADWERGDFGSVEWMHPEIEYVFADGPSPGRWTGVDGTVESFRNFLSGFKEVHFTADEFRELDRERVLVLCRGSGRGEASGLELGQMQTRAANLFHLRAGKVSRLVVYFDREQGLADLGLKE
jgi:ketosteroid isomerase-like protein